MAEDYCSRCGRRAEYRCTKCGGYFCHGDWGIYVSDQHEHSAHAFDCPECAGPALHAWAASRQGVSMVDCCVELGRITRRTTSQDVQGIFVAVGRLVAGRVPPAVIFDGRRSAPSFRVKALMGWRIEVGGDVGYLSVDHTWLDPAHPQRAGGRLEQGPGTRLTSAVSGGWVEPSDAITVNRGPLPAVRP